MKRSNSNFMYLVMVICACAMKKILFVDVKNEIQKTTASEATMYQMN